MKSVQFVIALVSLSILAVYVLATDVFATDSLPDETEVEKRLNQWSGAIKKSDVDEMLTFYVDDDKTTMILSSGSN